jgi:antitoxin component YwqK of YwqJK toxin-antitoxin module
MKKQYLLFIVLFFNSHLIFSQILKRSYYDFYERQKKEEYYVNAKGEQHGPYKSFNERGIVQEESTFVNGEMNGMYTQYYTGSGRQILRSKETYKNGVKNGPAFYYDEGILVRQGSFVNDAREGIWTYIDKKGYPDRKGFEYLKSTCTFKNGEPFLEGKYLEYFYPANKLYKEMTVKYGKAINDEKFWFPNGAKERVIKRDSLGTLISETIWHENGKLRLKQTVDGYGNILTYEAYTEKGEIDPSAVEFEKNKNMYK